MRLCARNERSRDVRGGARSCAHHRVYMYVCVCVGGGLHLEWLEPQQRADAVCLLDGTCGGSYRVRLHKAQACGDATTRRMSQFHMG